MKPIAITSEVRELLANDSPVAIGVSGGKDSSAVAFATVHYLNQIGHAGPRILIHSDLGATEWKESHEWCQRLADRLGLELVVVRRKNGGMMERWEQRWSNNVARYEALECVQLILPWSTPGMRFCTSELKVDVICQELKRRYPGHTIVNVNGIRRDESDNRANKPIWKPQPKLSGKTTRGIDWHPLIEWSLADVLEYLELLAFPLHPAYVLWSLSRVSCVFCILQNLRDQQNSTRCPANHDIYRRMVRLESQSTFAFQGNRWLGDVSPEILTREELADLTCAKGKADQRRLIESEIPRDLLYVKGWPIVIPTRAAARKLCDVRYRIGELMGFEIQYTRATGLLSRYEQLWKEGQELQERKARKTALAG